ncbi:MAG: IS30 family transposase [Sulfitobacter sp.]|jgi:IS30 family transposase
MGIVYTQLSYQERRRIEDWWLAKVPVAEMARVLKRHKSTIFHEIKRNFWADDAFPKKYAGYFGIAAHQRTQQRRSTQRKLIRHSELCQNIVARLKNGWTPEQIGNRMIYEGAKLRACQEMIYPLKKAWRRSFGGTCPSIARTAHHAVPANVNRPSLTVMSASCSAQITLPTAASLGIGKVT